MKGEYITNNGEVNVVEYDPSLKKARIVDDKGNSRWVSQSEHSKWEQVKEVEETIAEPAEVIQEDVPCETQEPELIKEPIVELPEEPEQIIEEEKPKKKRTYKKK